MSLSGQSIALVLTIKNKETKHNHSYAAVAKEKKLARQQNLHTVTGSTLM